MKQNHKMLIRINATTSKNNYILPQKKDYAQRVWNIVYYSLERRDKMAGVQVYNFGMKNGIQTYRVIGDKADLYKIIEECREMDAKFGDTPVINHVRKGQWTMILKLKFPAKVGGDKVE
jgi:hypothetical protein